VPGFAIVPDPVCGPTAEGRIRYDLRTGPAGIDRPPLVLLGGMTQTIASWGGQLRPLSATRTVVAYEARGQGSTSLSIAQVDLPRHVEDFVALVHALALPTPLDLCGFSFGGRVSLAVAATRPELVRRLVLSGVGLDRGVVGRLVVAGWIASLRTGDLEALARISLPDIAGPKWLAEHEQLVESMVTAVVQRNSFEAIAALLRQTLQTSEGSPWATRALVERVRCPALVMGGAHDRLAPPDEVRELAARLDAGCHVFADAGHTIPIEVAQDWRDAVLAFLDEHEARPPRDQSASGSPLPSSTRCHSARGRPS
jgi:3-oxoadipate enol-lactonase